MLIDFSTYISTVYPDIPNRPINDLGICIVCENTIIVDVWYKEYIDKSGRTRI